VAETAPFADAPRQMLIAAGYLYMADPPFGLRVVDVRDPAQPHVVGEVALPGETKGVAVEGQHVYAACGEAGVRVVDVGDPNQPVIVGSLATRRITRAVVLLGDYAYVAERDQWESGIRVVDVRDPRQPEDLGFLHTPGGADFLTLTDDFGYVLGASGQIWVLDIDDPASPRRWGTTTIGSCRRGRRSQQPGIPPPAGTAHGMVVLGDRAYVPYGTRGLCVVDISFGGRPVVEALVDTPGDARGVAVRGRRVHAFVADWNRGMRVIELADPAEPEEVNAYDSPGKVYDVAAADGFLCVADWPGGVRVVDVSDPTRPRLAGYQATTGSARGVAAFKAVPPSTGAYCIVAEVPHYSWRRVGDRYVRDLKGGLQIVDVRNPAAPDLMGTFDGYSLADVTISSGHIYGASQADRYPPPSPTPDSLPFNGLQVFDFTPNAPADLGGLELPGRVLDVAVEGDRAYLAAETAGLQIVDVSDPNDPRPVGSITTGALDDARAVAAAGSYVFVAAGDAGLRMFDVSDPTRPQGVGGQEIPGGAIDVAVEGSHAVVADGASGVQLVDVTDPSEPRWLDRYTVRDAEANVVAVDTSGSLVYLGVDPATILVLEVVERPVPTASPGPTDTATATPTPTGVPTPTPTATPTIRRPPWVYLPVLWK